MHWLTMTHVARWRAHRGTIGRGHLYQGPYKSVAVECDLHLLITGRYIERNARTANLVQRAEEWRWCSLWRRLHPHICDGLPPLSEWPADRPEAWVDIVNEPQTEKELVAMKQSLLTGRPFGSTAWQQKVALEMGLDPGPRPRGRPRK
jgi:putative transposase